MTQKYPDMTITVVARQHAPKFYIVTRYTLDDANIDGTDIYDDDLQRGLMLAWSDYLYVFRLVNALDELPGPRKDDHGDTQYPLWS